MAKNHLAKDSEVRATLKTGGKPLAVTVMGPTAAGKTDLAIALSERLPGDIISVDSALIYKGMDIGTAKPSEKELSRAPHRLISILDPSENYSVAQFCRDATKEVESIVSRGRTPILVGGTMMYFKALLEGLSDMPASKPEVRGAVEAEAKEKGWPFLHGELEKVDPETAKEIHPNHSQRISRALEIYRQTGKPMSQWRVGSADGLLDKYNWVQMAVGPLERTVLHKRIALRFEKMLEQGFLEEVQALRARGDLHEDMPSIRAVGYRQAWHYLADINVGEQDPVASEKYKIMVEKGIAATRQLAKRQYTWLKNWQNLHWIYTQEEGGVMRHGDEIVKDALNFIAENTI